MTDTQPLHAFLKQTIPLEEWDHRKHLRLAYIFLQKHPFEEALHQIRTGIQAYNATKDNPEGLAMGYHETMTVAWTQLVSFTMLQFGPEADSETFLDAQPQLDSKTMLRLFYSRERILSPEAKQRFVLPDLTDFPTPAASPPST